MTELYDDFRDLLVALHDAGAEFLVVGGYALAFHGHPRATKDLDVFCRPTKSNAEKVIAGLGAFGAPLKQLRITVADFETAGTVVQIGVAPVRVDLITEISGLTFDEAVAEPMLEIVIDGRTIRVIGRAALMRNKLASGRPQDLADVEALRGRSDG